MIIWNPGTSLEDMEERVIKEALAFYKDETKTAESLKITVEELREKIKKHRDKMDKFLEEREIQRQKAYDFERRARGLPSLEEPIKIPVELPKTSKRSKHAG